MSVPHTNSAFNADERATMRAYLQRCEVRISTQHRIATAFIGGAGLLLLIPIFLRDIVDKILVFLVPQIANVYPTLAHPWSEILSAIFFSCMLYVFLLSLIIPLLGVYWMLEDLLHFYFTLYAPGFSERLLNPTLALGGINFSPDESEHVKKAVMRRQYQSDSIGFVMPFSDGRREAYFDRLIEDTEGDILPTGRNLQQLTEAGIIGADADSQKHAQHLNTAMGIARAIDRQLVEEVALSEMQMTRNTLYLRRLLLRYVKTMLMFLWTTVILFVIVPLLEKGSPLHHPTTLALGLLVWALPVWWFMRRPVMWIYRHRGNDSKPRHLDAQLTKMETRLRRWVQVGQVLAVLGAILGVLQVI